MMSMILRKRNRLGRSLLLAGLLLLAMVTLCLVQTQSLNKTPMPIGRTLLSGQNKGPQASLHPIRSEPFSSHRFVTEWRKIMAGPTRSRHD